MNRRKVNAAKAVNAVNADINDSAMIRICSFIVDKRMLFFLIYILVLIFSMFSSKWVKVENDLAEYLSDTTETREGLNLMEKEFVTFGSAEIMVNNITFGDALDVQQRIESMSGVSSVTFTEEDALQDDFEKHYNNGAALFEVTFDYDEDDSRALETLNLVRDELSSYDIYVSTTLGTQKADIVQAEVNVILVLVAFVVVGVLLITSESFGEIPVLVLTFVVAMLINNGTNFFFGTISFVSNSVSSILQLALSVDYAIIFCNRFKEERAGGLDVRDSVVVSLSKSIPEILSSSLTTISGLFALIFMQYGIGADLGIILIKAILLALLSAFTLMPGLLVIFSGLMEKTRHKSFVPKISFLGIFAYFTRHVGPILFIVVFVVSFLYSQRCPYVYGYSTLSTPVLNEVQIAENMITDNFGSDNMVALVVPGGDYYTEGRLIANLETRPEVDHCVGLSNTEARQGYMLTDQLSPRQFSELLDVDYEVVTLLYSMYASDQEEYGRIIGGIGSYKVPLMDMFMFLYEKEEEGYVSLDPETHDELADAYKQISNGRKQLEGENYDRILIYLTLPEESEETFRFLDEIHRICTQYYDNAKVYVVGESTSERDLKASFERDNIVVSIVSALFVLVILLFTFKSAGLPVLLIVVIEGAIFLNFSFPTLMHSNLFFMSYLIVSSIQMGANIDYAIVISSRYLELRKTQDKKTSIMEALNFAFPTIITSGSMMILSGVFIARMTSEPAIVGIGECLARGTAISILLVMTVLPQILLVGDKLIQLTTFDIARPVRTKDVSGTVLVNGTIRGTINGTVIGSMNAVVRGDVKAIVVSGNVERMEDTKELPGGDIEDLKENPAEGEGKTGAAAEDGDTPEEDGYIPEEDGDTPEEDGYIPEEDGDEDVQDDGLVWESVNDDEK